MPSLTGLRPWRPQRSGSRDRALHRRRQARGADQRRERAAFGNDVHAAHTGGSAGPECVLKRILFVDDEPLVLQGLKAGLYGCRRDWDMQFAVGGEKAIELMAKAHFDVLVTDLRMPGVDGAALVARARAQSPDTIRIVLSGFAD